MKIRAAEYLLLGALSWAVLLFGGCKGEPSCPDETEQYSYIQDEYKKRLPYSGFDTLKFLLNSNDTIEVIGNGRLSFYEIEYKRDPNPDCNVYTKINYEGNRLVYRSKRDSIIMIQTECPCSKPGFELRINNDEYSFDVTRVGVKNLTFIPYFDSIYFNGTKYTEVTAFVINKDSIYMNRAHGLIRVKSLTKNNLDLIKQ